MVETSFVELYNSDFYDLFDFKTAERTPSNLRIADQRGPDGLLRVVVTGVVTLPAGSAAEVMGCVPHTCQIWNTCMHAPPHLAVH